MHTMTDLDISRASADLAKLQAETAKLTAERAKLAQERAKLRLESRKLNREAIWHPVGVAASLIGATAAITTALIGLGVALVKYMH